MATKPKTRKPTPAETSTAEALLFRIVGNHSQALLDSRNGEVIGKLVKEVYDISVAFHAQEVAA